MEMLTGGLGVSVDICQNLSNCILKILLFYVNYIQRQLISKVKEVICEDILHTMYSSRSHEACRDE